MTIACLRDVSPARITQPLGRLDNGRSHTTRARQGFARVGALACDLPRGRGGPEFSYKFANNLPASHPLNLRAGEAAGRILEATGGRVEIRLFPNNQLGSDTDVLSQLRSGAVELFTLSGLILSTLVPPAAINGVGFAFKDYDQVWPAMDGKLGAFIRGEIAKRGLVAMERIWDNGFRQTTTSAKPIWRRRTSMESSCACR